MLKICIIICLVFSGANAKISHGAGIEVLHSAGGQASALVIGEKYWYQAVGEQLLVLEKNGGAQVSAIELVCPAGGVCADLLLDSNSLYALIDGKEVVVFSILQSDSPVILRRISADELGFRPRKLALVSGSPVVMGDGGASRINDGSNIVVSKSTVTSVLHTLHSGVVYVTNRKIYDSANDTFLGSATELLPLDPSANALADTLVYIRTLEKETEVGLMNGELKDIGTGKGKVILPGQYEDSLVLSSRVLVATTEGVFVMGISPKEMRLLKSFDQLGVKNIGVIASNYLALSGDFGRGLFRMEDDSGGAGETLIRTVPANGIMRPGAFDNRGVQIPTENGSVYYAFGNNIVVNETIVREEMTPFDSVVLGSEVVIDEANGVVHLFTSSRETVLELASQASTVIAISGNFWFGTEDGIVVYGTSSENEFCELASINLAGPIVQLIPLLNGNVAFVSEAGFVGVVGKSQDLWALEQ
jgi:hypothetical protein